MDYKKILRKITYYQEHPPYAIPFYHDTLNRVLNGVEKGKSTVISGRANSGKTSFTDFYYVISLFEKYLETDPSNRKPLHIIYFELKTSEEKKLMKWFASYMMLKNKKLVDVNTLRNTTGKDFTYSPDIEDNLADNQTFFHELSEHMTMHFNPMNATDIYFKIKTYMESLGSYQDGIFKYDKEHEEQITLVVINNTARIRTELDGYSNKLDKDAVNEKLSDYLQELMDKFSISPVVIQPIRDIGNIGKGAPELRQLGIFGTTFDQGIVMYNPFNYGNTGYLGYDINQFLINGKNRFISASIMKNNSGIDQAALALIFLGEAGYFSRCPQFSQEVDLGNILETLGSI